MNRCRYGARLVPQPSPECDDDFSDDYRERALTAIYALAEAYEGQTDETPAEILTRWQQELTE